MYCGFVRDRGMVLTSATSVTSAIFNSLTNSAIDRVEWPMVKTGKVISDPAGRWIYEQANRLRKRRSPALHPREVESVLRGCKRVRRCDCCGILNAMKATIDSAGRIVVPKALRKVLGLKAGQRPEIPAGDGCLKIEIASTPMKLKKRGKGVVAVPDAKLPALTTELVRETLERVRR